MENLKMGPLAAYRFKDLSFLKQVKRIGIYSPVKFRHKSRYKPCNFSSKNVCLLKMHFLTVFNCANVLETA